LRGIARSNAIAFSGEAGTGLREENALKGKGLDRQRLDKFLWHARVVKARTSAAQLVEKGHVRVNGVRETSPGHAVKLGDVLTIGLDRSVRVLKVIGFSERRGDAAAARVLYEDLHTRPE
jgi:ribosome-associated heat shock protein Hsp15